MGCLYDCDYCYLQGLYPSANTVLFVNLEDAFEQLRPYLGRDTLVATSYDTDTLAIESLTHQTREWLEFAAEQEHLHLEIRTKSANIKSLKLIAPNPRVTLAWTLSPQEIIDAYEHATPSFEKRLSAAQEAITLGWKVRLCIDPVIYTDTFDTLQLIRKPSNISRWEVFECRKAIFVPSKNFAEAMSLFTLTLYVMRWQPILKPSKSVL
jgi:spore photoproduct lyase